MQLSSIFRLDRAAVELHCKAAAKVSRGQEQASGLRVQHLRYSGLIIHFNTSYILTLIVLDFWNWRVASMATVESMAFLSRALYARIGLRTEF